MTERIVGMTDVDAKTVCGLTDSDVTASPECDELRKTIDRLFAACVGKNNEILRLLAENKRLRMLTSLLSVINKHLSLCSITDCGQCPVSSECEESVHLEGLLGIDSKEANWRVQWRSEDAADVQMENAKLRELVDGLRYCANEAHGMCARNYPGSDEYMERCPLYGDDGSYGCERLMRELGIEVEG